MGCLAKADHFIHAHMKFALNRRHEGRPFDLRSNSIKQIIYNNFLDIPDTMAHIVSEVPQCVIRLDYRKCNGISNAPSAESQIIFYFVYTL